MKTTSGPNDGWRCPRVKYECGNKNANEKSKTKAAMVPNETNKVGVGAQ